VAGKTTPGTRTQRNAPGVTPPLFSILKPPKAPVPSSLLIPQTLALSEMHHDLLFVVSFPRGAILDLNSPALRRLGRDREDVIGKTLSEVLGVGEIGSYLRDLPTGRPVRWTQRLSFGGDSAPGMWDIRASRPTAPDTEALVAMHPVEEHRPGSGGSTGLRLEELPAFAAEASHAGTPKPLLDWIVNSVQASCAGLYYTHRETGRLALAYENALPPEVPREWPALSPARRETYLLWTGETQDTEIIASWAAQAGLHAVVLLPLPETSVEGMLMLGWREGEPYTSFPSALAAFSAAHGALLREWQSKGQYMDSLQKNRRADAALQILMDELPQALLVVQAGNGRVTETSLSCERMLGYNAAALSRMRPEDWLTAPEAVVAVRAACESGRINESGELTLYRRDGEGFPAMVRVIPLRAGPAGEFHEVLVTITDMTSSRDAQQGARNLQHQAVLGWMAASFAHEIRNPLNNLSLQLEEMRTLYSLPPDVARLAEEAKAECNRLTEISRRMLDFARGQDFHLAPTDMVALVRRVLQRMQPALERAGVKSIFTAPEDLPPAMADSLSIEQVIINLIDNAAKAMPEGGHLGVSLQSAALESGAPAVEVRVADTGQGLPPQVREKLFQPYITTRSDGHGLGLALSRHILDAHYGALRAETFPGSGTVFHVLLPVAGS
jgi:PAS domain S-box-containing protein